MDNEEDSFVLESNNEATKWERENAKYKKKFEEIKGDEDLKQQIEDIFLSNTLDKKTQDSYEMRVQMYNLVLRNRKAFENSQKFFQSQQFHSFAGENKVEVNEEKDEETQLKELKELKEENNLLREEKIKIERQLAELEEKVAKFENQKKDFEKVEDAKENLKDVYEKLQDLFQKGNL